MGLCSGEEVGRLLLMEDCWLLLRRRGSEDVDGEVNTLVVVVVGLSGDSIGRFNDADIDETGLRRGEVDDAFTIEDEGRFTVVFFSSSDDRGTDNFFGEADETIFTNKACAVLLSKDD